MQPYVHLPPPPVSHIPSDLAPPGEQVGHGLLLHTTAQVEGIPHQRHVEPHPGDAIDALIQMCHRHHRRVIDPGVVTHAIAIAVAVAVAATVTALVLDQGG